MTTDAQQPFESGQAIPAGTVVGQFRILSVLGAGGFGITYIAEDTVIGRQVVIKENFPKFCSYRDRSNYSVMPLSTKHAASLEKSHIDFEKEAKMLAALPHRNIVPVYSIFQAHGTVFFVMPLILGPTLSKHVLDTREQKKPSLDEPTLRRHLALILQCLDFIHSHNVWHRDIKPDNLIISSETGEPVLIDFGAARQTMLDVTQSMTLIGTYGFGAPEQLIGKKVGAYSDIYALGATLYSVITGEIPERGDLRLFQDSLVPLCKIPHLTQIYSSDFLSSIDRAMRPRVEFRTATAQDWLDELSGMKPISKTTFQRTSLRGIVPTGEPIIHRKPATRLPLIHQLAFFFILTILLLVGGWFFFNLKNSSPTTKPITVKVEKSNGYDGTVISTGEKPIIVGRESTVIAPEEMKLGEVSHKEGVRWVAFSPDGKYLATGSYDNTARVTELSTGKIILEVTQENDVMEVAFSPDGKYLASENRNGIARVTEIATGQEKLLVKHDRNVSGVAFSPDGKYLATTSWDFTARITEIDTGKVALVITHDEKVSHLAYSPDGKVLATGGWDKTARLTEIATEKKVVEVKYTGAAWLVRFSPDGKYLATASMDGTARITEIATGKTVLETKHSSAVRSIAISQDGRYFATASQDGTARVIEISAERTILNVTYPVEGTVLAAAIAFLPDGKHIVAALADGIARVIDLATKEVIMEVHHAAAIYSLAMSPDGLNFATASEDGRALVYNMSDALEKAKLAATKPPVPATSDATDATKPTSQQTKLDESSENPNQADADGNTALHRTLFAQYTTDEQKKNRKIAVKTLMDKKADISLLNKKGESPSSLVMKINDKDLIKIVFARKISQIAKMEAGTYAWTNKKGTKATAKLLEATDSSVSLLINGKSVSILITDFCAEDQELLKMRKFLNDIDKIDSLKLCQEIESLVTADTSVSNKAKVDELIRAIRTVKTVQELNAVQIAFDGKKISPLAFALTIAPKVCRVLLEAGARLDLNAISDRFYDEYIAKNNCNFALLLEFGEAHPNMRFANGSTPLINAIWTIYYSSDEQRVLELIGMVADVGQTGIAGTTALHEASKLNQLSVLQELIAKNAPLNTQDVTGQTPIHLAIDRQNPDAVKLLLEAGANLYLKDKQGMSSLQMGLNSTCLPIFEEIIFCFSKRIKESQPVVLLTAKGKEVEGIIQSIYPNNFIIKVKDKDLTVPFSQLTKECTTLLLLASDFHKAIETKKVELAKLPSFLDKLIAININKKVPINRTTKYFIVAPYLYDKASSLKNEDAWRIFVTYKATLIDPIVQMVFLSPSIELSFRNHDALAVLPSPFTTGSINAHSYNTERQYIQESRLGKFFLWSPNVERRLLCYCGQGGLPELPANRITCSGFLFQDYNAHWSFYIFDSEGKLTLSITGRRELWDHFKKISSLTKEQLDSFEKELDNNPHAKKEK